MQLASHSSVIALSISFLKEQISLIEFYERLSRVCLYVFRALGKSQTHLEKPFNKILLIVRVHLRFLWHLKLEKRIEGDGSSNFLGNKNRKRNNWKVLHVVLRARSEVKSDCLVSMAE